MKLQDGSMLLLVVMLMSMLMVLSTRLWRSTASVMDIALQKQLYVQKKWAMQGILACGLAACKADPQAMRSYLLEQGGTLSMPLTSYLIEIPSLQPRAQQLTFTLQGEDSIVIEAQLIAGNATQIATTRFSLPQETSHNALL